MVERKGGGEAKDFGPPPKCDHNRRGDRRGGTDPLWSESGKYCDTALTGVVGGHEGDTDHPQGKCFKRRGCGCVNEGVQQCTEFLFLLLVSLNAKG